MGNHETYFSTIDIISLEDLPCFSYLEVNSSELLSEANCKLWKMHVSLVIYHLRKPQIANISTVGGIVLKK